MELSVCLVALFLVAAILLYALRCKGDVKAALRIPFVELSLETKDTKPPSKPGDATQKPLVTVQDSPAKISTSPPESQATKIGSARQQIHKLPHQAGFRMPERAFAQVEPLFAPRILDEEHLLDAERLG